MTALPRVQPREWTATGIACCLVVAAGAGIAKDPVVAGISGGVALVALAVVFPVMGLLATLVLGILQYSLTKAYPILPTSFTLVDDVLVLALFLRWIGAVGLRRTSPPIWFVGCAGVWLGMAAINLTLNGVEATWALEAVRSMFLPLLLYPIACQYAGSERIVTLFLRTIVLVILACGVVAVIQAATIGGIGDKAYGLLGPGGANVLGFILLLGFVVVLSSPRGATWRLVAAALLIGGIVASGARAALVASPIVLLPLLRGRRGKVALVLGGICVVLASGYLAIGAFSHSGLDSSSLLSPRAVLNSQRNASQCGRLLYLEALPRVFRGDTSKWLVGVGAGQYTSVVGTQRRAPAYLKERPSSSTSSTGYAFADLGWTTILGEYGVLGLICVLLILARPASRSLRSQMTLHQLPPARQTLARAVPAVVFVGMAASLIVNAFEYQPFAYPLWLLLGLYEDTS